MKIFVFVISLGCFIEAVWTAIKITRGRPFELWAEAAEHSGSYWQFEFIFFFGLSVWGFWTLFNSM